MSNENPSNVINLNHVAVPGAAVIGADIALCFALHRADVVLRDVSLGSGNLSKETNRHPLIMAG